MGGWLAAFDRCRCGESSKALFDLSEAESKGPQLDPREHIDSDCGAVWRFSIFLHFFEDVLLLSVIFLALVQLTLVRNQRTR